MTVIAVFEVRLLPDADVEAQERYAEYKARVAPMIEAAGGRYLLRAALGETLDGDATGDADRRWHVIEFPSADAARTFWSSDAYAGIVPLREGAVDVRAVVLG